MILSVQGEIMGTVSTYNVVDALAELGAIENEDGEYELDGCTFGLEDAEIVNEGDVE